MKTRKAYTMIEISIVLAIMFVFISIVVSTIGKSRSNAQPISKPISTAIEINESSKFRVKSPSSVPMTLEDMQNWIDETSSVSVEEQQLRMKILVNEIQRLRRKAGE